MTQALNEILFASFAFRSYLIYFTYLTRVNAHLNILHGDVCYTLR